VRAGLRGGEDEDRLIRISDDDLLALLRRAHRRARGHAREHALALGDGDDHAADGIRAGFQALDRHPVADGDQIGLLIFLFEPAPKLANDGALQGINGEKTTLRADDQTCQLFAQSCSLIAHSAPTQFAGRQQQAPRTHSPQRRTHTRQAWQTVPGAHLRAANRADMAACRRALPY